MNDSGESEADSGLASLRTLPSVHMDFKSG